MHTEQVEMVKQAALGVSPHWPRRRYEIVLDDERRVPKPGECVTTLPGAYWHVIAAHVTTTHPGRCWAFTLEALRPTSVEAHGAVAELYGGTLS